MSNAATKVGYLEGELKLVRAQLAEANGQRIELLELLRLLHGRSAGPDKIAIEQALGDSGNSLLHLRQRMVCFIRDWFTRSVNEACAQGWEGPPRVDPMREEARQILIANGLPGYE